jgi:TRAP-type C4-dicarboxylate transport system substrate-binding protein
MKKVVTLFFALLLTFGILAGCKTPVAAATGTESAPPTKANVKAAELSLSIQDSAISIKGVMYQEWCDQVTAASNGALKVTLYAGGVLAAESNGLDTMEAGACDIIWFFTTNYPTLFSLTDIVSLPMMGIDSAGSATNFLWDLYEQSPEMAAEYKDYKVIHIYTNPVSYLNMAHNKISRLSDLKGVNIRTSGGTMQSFVGRLGANAVSIGATDLYESLEKGIIDGFVQNGSGIASWHLEEVTKYFVDMPLYVGTWLCLMKADTYNALPEDARAAIDAYSGRENSVYFASAAQTQSDEAYAAAVAGGASEWIKLSDAAYAEFLAVAKEFNAEWVANHGTADFDAQAYYDLAMGLLAK